MTLVLALRCRDAIVLASDGQSTADTVGQPTRQPTRKLFELEGRIAWGTAGSAGLQQTLLDRLAGQNGSLSASATGIRECLAAVVIPVQQLALEHYVPQPGTEPPLLISLFCWFDDAGPRILEIPRTGSDHQFHDRFAAIGSGEIFAKFAMASLAHIDPTGLDLEQAKMVAYRAVADAINVAAVFLGPPIQMCVVNRDGARPVPREEIDGCLADSVDTWRARQFEMLGSLSPTKVASRG